MKNTFTTRLRVSEVFASIQGEGLLSGVPSTFVRLSGCNLRCVWCDTPYASWRPEGDFANVENLVEKVIALGINHVVLTGGEPMIFDPIELLCEELKWFGVHITIETAGTVFREVACDLMSISPKLSNSTPPEESGWRSRHEKTRTNLEALRKLIESYSVQLKFVIGDRIEEEVAEVESLLQSLPRIDKDHVLLMPEGTEVGVLRERIQKLVPFAIERGWRLSPRLHIELFGNKRGT